MLACRPEDVRIEPAHETPGLEPLVGHRRERGLPGERIEYEVRTAAGRSLVVFGSRRDRHAVGATVSLCVDSREVTVWPQA